MKKQKDSQKNKMLNKKLNKPEEKIKKPKLRSSHDVRGELNQLRR